jgi:cell division protein ZipA
MPELRWILLGLGLLFFIWLWWRETRRPHQAANSSARAGEPERIEPPIALLDKHRRTVPEPAVYEPPIYDDGLEVEIDMDPTPEIEPAEPSVERAAQDRIARELFARPMDGAFERIEPVLAETEYLPEEAAEVEAPPPVEQRIVTLRLSAPPLERFGGTDLVEALRAAGLEHGKFSIFHKTTPAGATLFSVASLVEPGTFDLEHIAGRRFAGVSLFAVLPGPMEATALLEDMIASGRKMAERLQGILQDERGVAMTPQRLADLRAGIADWQRRAAGAHTKN